MCNMWWKCVIFNKTTCLVFAGAAAKTQSIVDHVYQIFTARGGTLPHMLPAELLADFLIWCADIENYYYVHSSIVDMKRKPIPAERLFWS